MSWLSPYVPWLVAPQSISTATVITSYFSYHTAVFCVTSLLPPSARTWFIQDRPPTSRPCDVPCTLVTDSQISLGPLFACHNSNGCKQKSSQSSQTSLTLLERHVSALS